MKVIEGGGQSTEDTKDPPIEPAEFTCGVRTVDIGDLRVARGLSRRARSKCRHSQLHYDTQERRIWCPDCERNIDSFDAFVRLTEQWYDAKAAHDRREKRVQEAESHALISRASKELDKAWRSKRLAPCCAQCSEALLPEDFADGVGMCVSPDLARARRKAKAARP